MADGTTHATTSVPPEEMSDTDLCRTIFRLQAMHVFHTLHGSKPGTLNASTLDVCRKFLSDNGINKDTVNVPTMDEAMDTAFDDLPFK